MAEGLSISTGNVERFPDSVRPTPVSDELSSLAKLLREACPEGACISFSFDDKLQAHIDVRKREHVVFVQMILPTLKRGLFHSVSLGGTPHHPFYHRISAQVQA
jgi:hypothetical protein